MTRTFASRAGNVTGTTPESLLEAVALAAKKAARNTANARKAYNRALRLVQKVILITQESKQEDCAFARLKRELMQLGESLP